MDSTGGYSDTDIQSGIKKVKVKKPEDLKKLQHRYSKAYEKFEAGIPKHHLKWLKKTGGLSD